MCTHSSNTHLCSKQLEKWILHPMTFNVLSSWATPLLPWQSCWNTHPWPIFNALALTVHGPVHYPFDVVQLSCPLSRKNTPKHNVSTSMFDGGDSLGVIGSIPPPPNTASWVDAKELDFGLIWPQHFHPVLLWIIQMFIGKLQTGFQSFTA